ncbi:hypothetical protein GOP47_0000174 [Adiantum capillus-veneris]|uniref:Uncharacterized protein n=1 Tax=Adiantum capillus-veneris TaxID=13818 RepID=A0A9D4VDF9_ADICA|nr:hypothetical protein GOP47_0000174 [Adiantum capillus-veneris]
MTMMMAAFLVLAILLLLLFLLCFPRQFKPHLHIPSLHGKHVLITGGSSGIGLALAHHCLLQGSYVTLIARNADRLSQAAQSLVHGNLSTSASGVNGHSAQYSKDRILLKAADVSDAAAMSNAIAESFSWRPIDVLVCNAGTSVNGLFDDMKISDLETVTRINLLGCVYTIYAALPLMKARSKRHPSSIVIVSSLSGLLFVYGANMYSATKHALKGLAEVLRFELLSDNIKVSLVCPGFTETPLLDLADKHVIEGNKIFFYDRDYAEAAKVVAAKTMEGVKQGKFLITTSAAGLMVRILARGFTPAESLSDALLEIFLLVPLRVATHVWFPFAKRLIKKQQKQGLNFKE